MLIHNSSISTHFLISPQLTLPEGMQLRMWHTATALSLWPGQTQVTMFGGCPKFEQGKSDAALEKLAKTVVLDFGEQNTHDMHVSIFACYLCLIYIFYYQDKNTHNHFAQEAPFKVPTLFLASCPGSFPLAVHGEKNMHKGYALNH